ncbi:hypothetical protein AGABI2DRAFT_114966 [Agaricus bisporus var. bisporus H97]|uniref:hypothetical protein n=1 Tax=Agaricus bisporus var. bisporus (strain H97 / ATCC MYA-4626 / FGSC 10389) TaxID=936046 RepID=UPI00029F719A|nr:hypothetical protein AGABI2DRAFT_114966 [Agaricus bisporus var. bisporus H97]EKV49897.1 hypothetical protein AGABI2DRAFT_114966 [Agaricus bisporus var. bisporus H97]
MPFQAPPFRLGDKSYTKKLGIQRRTSSRLMSNSCREQARAHILDMKSQEVDAGHFLKEHIRQQSRQNDAYKEWHKSSGTFVAQLGQQRSFMIDETSKTLNMAATERNSTCRQFSKEARMQVEKSKEEEKLATDASSLIRHYKSLLIGTHDKKGQERKWG